MSEVRWFGNQVKARVQAGAVEGLRKAAEELLVEARRFVPIEEGTLERSGVADVDEAALRAAVSFDTPYAVRQHEEMDWHHDADRTAKYLENPLNSEDARLKGIIAGEIKRHLGA